MSIAAHIEDASADEYLKFTGVSLFTHDPSSLVKCGDRYYLYSSGVGVPSHSSADLLDWKAGPPVFPKPLDWWAKALPGWNASDQWAPDIAFFNGQYHLYYSISFWGKQTSAIGLATNPTLAPDDPKYCWTDQGIVVQSKEGSPYNAIDPCIFQDHDGSLWFLFGSYWGGIYIATIDPKTGKLPPNEQPKPLASGETVEAPTLYRRGDYYYLFTNRGCCCQGTNTDYHIHVGRGKSPAGPFYDKDGVDMAKGGGTLFMDKQGKYIGPGHISIFTKDGRDYCGFHYYDRDNQGQPTHGIRRLYWTDSGWPATNTPRSN